MRFPSHGDFSSSSFLPKIYLAIAVPALILLCFLTQPLHSVDEPAHFLRIVQIANGSVLPVLGPDQKSTGSYAGTGTRKFAYFYGDRFFRYMEPNRKTSMSEISELYRITDDRDRAYVEHSNTTIYFPLAYVAPVTAVAVAKLVSDRPLIWFYAGRLTNALLGAILTYLILCRATRGRLLLFAVALLPITLFQTAALSADSLLIPIAMALAVLLGRIIEGRALSTGDCIFAAVAGAFVGLGKIAYLPLVVILPVVALLVRRRLDRTVIGLACGSAMIILVWLLWSAEVRHLVFTVRQSDAGGEIDVSRQLALVVGHPWVFVKALLTTLGPRNLGHYAASFSGGLIGWIDTRLPLPVIILNLFALGAALGIDNQRRDAPGLVRTSVYLACFACVLAVFLFLYLQWNAVAARDIAGVQGRYFLPLLPFVCVVTPSLKVTGDKLRLLSLLLAGWGCFSAVITLVYVTHRYWGII